LLILDYGTALTADFVSRRGVFEGGLIIPGPELSLQALIQRAALLPKKMRLPRRRRRLLGRTTVECLTSGILDGYGAMTDGLAARLGRLAGRPLHILATGGFAPHVAPYCRVRITTDPGHTLKSLWLLYRAARQSR
jgi:type III pantothenate kinase